jgi:predicted MFS family arabinose efflux permease
MIRQSEFATGWKILAASCIGLALGASPIPFYEIGMFAPELARDFGWGVATIMGGIVFMMCGILLSSPIVGFIVDRYGARRTALVSIILFSAALSLFAMQTGSRLFYFATWFIVSIAGAGTMPVSWTRAINQVFDTHKGLALGITLAGSGISGFLLKPTTAVMIRSFGWRPAFMVLAAAPLLVAFPLAWLWFRPTQGSNGPTSDFISSDLEGLTLREALKDWRYWVIGFAILPAAFAVGGAVPNLEGIFRSHGIARDALLQIVPFIGIGVILGRVGGGWLLDRVWAPAVAMTLFIGFSVAFWLLISQSTSIALVWFVVLATGLVAGIEFDIMAFCAARYFGRRHYGLIYGTLSCFFALGAGTGPMIYGRIFDVTKSFDLAMRISATAILMSGALLLSLGSYRYRSPQASQASSKMIPSHS